MLDSSAMRSVLVDAGMGENAGHADNNFFESEINRQLNQTTQTPSGRSSASMSGNGAEKLNEIQELILLADLSVNPGDDESLENARRQVAIQLGCESEDLQDIVEDFGAEEWQTIVLAERVRRAVHTPQHKDLTWDRLEGAVLQKLVNLVEKNRVSAVGELLAIAKVANQAHRSYGKRGDGGQGAGGLSVTQNNYIAGQGGALPSGDLGTIKLTLSHRSVKQIEGELIREPGSPKTLDQMQMLTIEDVQKVGDSNVS